MRRLLAIASLVLLPALLLAHRAQAQRPSPLLQGQVTDSAGRALSNVRVLLVGLGRQQLTAPDGRYRFTSMPSGEHVVTFTSVGFAPQSRRVVLTNAGATLDARLRATGVELATVQVTATPAATLASESPQPTVVLEGAVLRQSQSASLGATLEHMPGVRSLSMTTGIGKPVIRGMTHYRVVTLDNGQRTETQAWGHDHSPNVETATAERVEVIKGPASVLYGSDALGGVINVIAPAVPDAIDGAAFVRGRLVSGYNHAVRGADVTLSGEGAVRGFGARAALTTRGSGDMRTPAGSLANTTNRATALEGVVGYRRAASSLSVRYVSRDERIEIFDDPAVNPEYSGFQRIDTKRATAEAATPMGAGLRLQLNGGYEQNYRREFADASASAPDLGLFVRNFTGFANVHHPRIAGMSGTVGVSAMSSDFANRGTQTLIPSSRTKSAGVYVFEQAEAGRVRATFGARYDYRTLATDGDPTIGIAAQDRAFSAVTGSAGLLVKLSEPVAVVLNVARGFRAPAAPDLFANGFHEGTRAFERGDPDLEVETSLNTELGLRVSRNDLTAEVTGYRNMVADYIYLRPFGTGGRVFDSLQVVQGDARLIGLEGRIAYRPLDMLTLHASGDVVRGDNLTARVPLTFIPPVRLLYGARVDGKREGNKVRNLFLAVSGETNARQTRLDPRDTSPPGYSLLSASAGFTTLVPRGAVIIDLSLRNALNTRYRDFMSRYKEFALSSARALALRVTAPL